MPTRERLPNRRNAENISFHVKDRPYVANVGYYDDGRIGELFIVSSGKVGADLNVSMLEIGVAVSIALQRGASLNELREAMPRTEEGRPEGAIGHLLDILAKPRLGVVT